MNVSMGIRLREGPWGGGNEFARLLTKHLRKRGDTVRYDLCSQDVDIIVLTEPRRWSVSSAFNDVDILAYLRRVNPGAIVVHRVNECDERKRTRLLNRRLALANCCADRTVFISDWLKHTFQKAGYCFTKPVVIRNGGDRSVFNPVGAERWDGVGRLKIVTHHWSNNWMKGFDMYGRIDDLLGAPRFRDLFEFTHVGRAPEGFRFRHARLVQPLTESRLGDELRRHHVYLTASRNEPAGMHHIEGALCGLPMLYRRSGALPEYCEGFGLELDESHPGESLLKMRECYRQLKEKMPSYPNGSRQMCDAYEAIFLDLFAHRGEIVRERRSSWVTARLAQIRANIYDRAYLLTLMVGSSRRLAMNRRSRLETPSQT